MSNSKGSWPSYSPQDIEAKWLEKWELTNLYRTEENFDKPKFYCLDFFPYPSGEGLHVGHCRNYVPTDVISRYYRMSGMNVLHPMGWDSFGEPSEQYAIAHGIHPRLTTDQNTANFKRQMRMIGTSYDWSREIDSSNPEFYRWTQWFFLKMYRRGLAYRDMNWQWWCPTCMTTLSSHEVNDGVCWRGHKGVIKREIPAWYFRITAYADELLSGLDEIDWPESIKSMQRNWIGRSEGCLVKFIVGPGEEIPIFTTRPDTLFGVTFLVLAPEHSAVSGLTDESHRAEVDSYINATSRKSDVDRMLETGTKKGVFTGGYVVNPINNERVPVWIADYVLPTYGTGAIMGVPAHDQRDFEFAHQNQIPIKIVISPPTYNGGALEEAYTGEGIMINSDSFNGLASKVGIQRITSYLEERGIGGVNIQYKMRDWLISRQRYWGTPIPIVYCDTCGEVPVPEENLPVLLPDTNDFAPDGSGRSPLARIPEFINTRCPNCDGDALRETDTMGGFACSSWYFLRFTSPKYNEGPFESSKMAHWMPVDLYVGGAEHAVLHLLYARFWTKVLADEELLPFREPFSKLINQGQLLAPDGLRMSKSRGNVITPDTVVQNYGADALRIYVMFLAPFEMDVNWSTEGIKGASRFLYRFWNLVGETYTKSKSETVQDPDLERQLNRTIKNVTERIREFSFNTMVSAMMEFINILIDRYRSNEWHTETFHRSLHNLIILLAPSAPYISEELWELTGNDGSVHVQAWPTWDDDLVLDQEATIAVQIDGKVRDTLVVPIGISEAYVRSQALNLDKVNAHLINRVITRFIYIPGRVLNIVTKV